MNENFAPLDLMRLLLGEGEKATALFYIEIVIRTAVMLAYTWFLPGLSETVR